jgi:hypothetical protein
MIFCDGNPLRPMQRVDDLLAGRRLLVCRSAVRTDAGGE